MQKFESERRSEREHARTFPYSNGLEYESEPTHP